MNADNTVTPTTETATTTIKVFVPKSSPIIVAFFRTIKFVDMPMVLVTDPDEAEMFLATEFDDLRQHYSLESRSFFCVLSSCWNPQQKNVGSNFAILNPANMFEFWHGAHALAQKLKEFKPVSKALLPVASFVMPSNTPSFRESYFVVVIDDNAENRNLASRLLKKHTLCTFRNLKEAIDSGLLEKAECVLTDMDMPPDKYYPALALNNYAPDETVSYGFAVMLEVTSRGLPVAIVTDGNHHQGWVSAMFDTMKGANVNHQRVLFFNNIGKRWDIALKDLMEPEENR